MRKPFCLLMKIIIILHHCTRRLVQNCILLVSGNDCQNALQRTFDFPKHRKTIAFYRVCIELFPIC